MIVKLKPSSCGSLMSLDLMVSMQEVSTSLGGSSPIRRSTEQTSMRRVSVAGSPRRAESENQNGVLRRRIKLCLFDRSSFFALRSQNRRGVIGSSWALGSATEPGVGHLGLFFRQVEASVGYSVGSGGFRTRA